MLLRILQANSIGDLHDFICDEISYSPTFINGKLFDIRDQTLLDFVVRQSLGKMDATIDTLHSYGVLVILVKVSKNLEKILLRHKRDQLNHVVEDKRSTLSNLRNFVLGCLSEKTIINSLVYTW